MAGVRRPAQDDEFRGLPGQVGQQQSLEIRLR
jgi:hypothetical protein